MTIKSMKRSYIFGLSLLLGMLAGCVQPIEEPVPAAPQVFTGVIETSESTKTVLGALEDGVHKVKWSVGDVVLIGKVRHEVSEVSADGLSATFVSLEPSKVPLKQCEATTSATATGGMLYWKRGKTDFNTFSDFEDTYYVAWYPPEVLDTTSFSDHFFRFSETQYYREGRIDNLPMVAISRNTEFVFRNLCAVLAISLTGNGQTVGKIRVNGTSQTLSGWSHTEGEHISRE